MKTIMALLICAVAIGCIGFAPSKADAGWYGRRVGISVGIGPRYGYGYRRYGYYGHHHRPYGYYGYRRYGHYGYRHHGYRAYRRW
jgi:hypothetical protein